MQRSLDLRGKQSVGEILKHIYAESRTEREKGNWFERLFAKVAIADLSLELEALWSWADWPDREKLTGLDAKDIGIDQVGITKDGKCIAIQCKCRDPKTNLRKPEIDSFVAASQQPCFDMRWIVCTNRWGPNALATLERANPPIVQIDFNDYLDTQVLDGTVERPIREPNALQIPAIGDVLNGLQNHDRGQLIMACGTGKTFTSLRIAEGMVPAGGKILFAAPSIALVSQARKEWLRHTTRKIDSLVVCSDSTAGQDDDSEDIRITEIPTLVTTDSKRIKEWLESDGTTESVKVVFSTYHSLKRITATGAEFDLAVADEAHKTTGKIETLEEQEQKEADLFEQEKVEFTLFHDSNRLAARKRLYMTATPRVYSPQSLSKALDAGVTVVDMEDELIYGRELHHVSFKKAVEQKLLSDYRVIVLGVDEGSVTPKLHERLAGLPQTEANQKKVTPSTNDIGRVLGLSLAMNGSIVGDDPEIPHALPRVIAYARTIARSQWFKEAIREGQVRAHTSRRMPKGQRSREVEASHLDGRSTALERSNTLQELRNAADEGALRVVMNAKLFTEGVDVPTLDAVAFLDPKSSVVDNVQSIGRVMRKAPGKTFGWIIIPVVIPPGADVIEELKKNKEGYRHVGRVLAALQSHDSRLAEEPWRIKVAREKPNRPEDGPNGGGDGEKPLEDEWEQGTLDLVTGTERLYAQLGSISGLGTPGRIVADQIKSAVKSAGAMLAEEHSERELEKLPGLDYEEAKPRDICTLAGIILFNACMLHKRLEGLPHMADVERIETAIGSADIQGVLMKAWKIILKRDYRPVFGIACRVLRALSERPPVRRAIARIAQTANGLADDVGKMRYDHAGPLYHEMLPSQKSDGALYTGNVGATFLAELAADEGTTDWEDENQIRSLKVWDPACGTGTLLLAALNAIKDRSQKEGRKDLHRTLVEESIAGTDINPIAIQLAASNLTLGAPTVDYQQMHLYSMDYGVVEGGTAKLGALEVIAQQHRDLGEMAEGNGKEEVEGKQVDGSEVGFVPEELDLVIMNPPFTNLKDAGSRLGKEGQQAFGARGGELRAIVKEQDEKAFSVVDNVKSIRPWFTLLAEKSLKREKGTLAKVLPLAAAVVTSGRNERKFIAERFHLETVVACHHHSEFAYSQNTDIHECMVIARRKGGDRRPTRFVVTDRMPKDAEEAKQWAENIREGNCEGFGVETLWPEERVREGDWSPVQWWNGELAELAWELRETNGWVEIGERWERSAAGGGPAHYWR